MHNSFFDLDTDIKLTTKRTTRKKKIGEPEKYNFGSHFSILLHECWEYYLNQLINCKEHFSEEAVHDLRVSIRRFQSLLNLLDELVPNLYIREIKTILSTQIKSFSVLRDTQVQILKVFDMRKKFPELNYYFYDLLDNEQELINGIQEKIVLYTEDELEGLVFFLRM